jgi:elongation factor P
MRVVGEKRRYLKEGIEIKALFYGNTLFSIELPQFLELMVTKTEGHENEQENRVNATKTAVLETGATLEVPLFIETGDIVRLDGETKQYIQRV